MIQLLSRVNIVDNSGILTGRVIKILTPKNKKIGKLGSLILISSKTQIKNSNILSGSKFKALFLFSKYIYKNNDKSLTFNENGVVIVKAAPKNIEYLPVGTRIKGPISSKLLRLNGYQKVISLSKIVL